MPWCLDVVFCVCFVLFCLCFLYLTTEKVDATVQLIATLTSGNIVFPKDWNYKENGVTIRAKIMGEPIYRKLILQISHRKSDDPSLTTTAYLQFDNYLHVEDYDVEDRIHRKNDGEPTEDKIDSFWLVKFMAKGCTAIGLDIDETGASANVLMAAYYVRRRARA